MPVYLVTEDELYHHGIRGQKWGDRNGPPYPLQGGDYSKSEVKEIYKARKSKNSIYNKKHFDTVLDANKTTLRTFSYDKNRTKNTDMFYAAANFYDKTQYNLWFNEKAPKNVVDENGKSLRSPIYFKYAIDNKLKSDIKVASEDSGAKVFAKLFKESRDFYNFLTDDARMRSYFSDRRKNLPAYKEGFSILDRVKNGEKVDESDISKLYRLFNYVIPYDGRGDKRAAADMLRQRARFFDACRKEGYGALLDLHDSVYGTFEAKYPVIVFDMDAIVPDKIKRTKLTDKLISGLVFRFIETSPND